MLALNGTDKVNEFCFVFIEWLISKGTRSGPNMPAELYECARVSARSYFALGHTRSHCSQPQCTARVFFRLFMV